MDGRRWARTAQVAAIVGTLAITGASLATAFVYTGTAGEPYSPLNHWVSELGQRSASQAAALFDLGLIVSGICFVIFVAGLVTAVPGRLRIAWGATGVVAGVAGAFVGVFPMDDLAPHSVAALTFFVLGWLTVLVASLDLVRQRDPRFPRWLAGIAAITTVAFVLFMVALFTDPRMTGDVLAAPEVRPAVWPASILEWAVVVSVVGWTLATALAWMLADRRAAATKEGRR